MNMPRLLAAPAGDSRHLSCLGLDIGLCSRPLPLCVPRGPVPGTRILDIFGSAHSGSRRPGYGAPSGANDMQRHLLPCNHPLGVLSHSADTRTVGVPEQVGRGAGAIGRGWRRTRTWEEPQTSPGATGHSIKVSSFCRVGHLSTPSLWKTSWFLGPTPASFTCLFLPPSLLLGYHTWPLAPWVVWGSQRLPAAVTPTQRPHLCLYAEVSTELGEGHFQLPLALSAGKTYPASEAATGGRACRASCLTRPPSLLSWGSPAPASRSREAQLCSVSPVGALSLSWLQLSSPGALTTSEVPDGLRPPAWPSPPRERSCSHPCATPHPALERLLLHAPLLGTLPGLSETLRQPPALRGLGSAPSPPGLRRDHRAVWEKVSGR